MYVATIYCFHYSGQESKDQSALYDSDIPVTFKSGQGHQIEYELLGTKRGYNHAQFERPPLNSVRQKANAKVFVKLENTSRIFLEYAQKWRKKNSGIFITYFTYLTILQSFNLIA